MTPCPLPDLLIELQLQLQPNHQILQLQVFLANLLLCQWHQIQVYLQLKGHLEVVRGKGFLPWWSGAGLPGGGAATLPPGDTSTPTPAPNQMVSSGGSPILACHSIYRSIWEHTPQKLLNTVEIPVI